MLATKKQQLYELKYQVGHVKGRTTTESAQKLETRVSVLEAKAHNSNNKSLSQMKTSPKKKRKQHQAVYGKGLFSQMTIRVLLMSSVSSRTAVALSGKNTS